MIGINGKLPGRQTELKHGRVSMLATMGYITPELTGKLPGYLSPSAGLKFADPAGRKRGSRFEVVSLPREALPPLKGVGAQLYRRPPL